METIRKKRTRFRLLFVVTVLLFGLPRHEGWEIGASLLALGGLLHALAAAYLTKNEVLTAAGPYRFVRNPFYVADFLRDLGILFACHYRFNYHSLSVWWFAAIYLGMMYGLVIRRRVLQKEEPELAERLGERYEAYRREVPRFVPRPWPAASRGEAHFSWQTMLRNRELPRLLVSLGLIVITYYRWEAFHHEFRLAKMLNDRWELSLFMVVPAVMLLSKIRVGAKGSRGGPTSD